MLSVIGVNSLDDGPVNLADGKVTLRDAIAMANEETGYPGADQIVFDAALGLDAAAGRIELTEGQLVFSTDITLAGPGASRLTIDAKSLSRAINIQGSSTATIDGLTITGGNAGRDENGGGIINCGSLTLTNVVVSGNTAAYGGGIQSSGSLSISRSTLSQNSAVNDGGAIHASGSVILLDSNLSNNTAGHGGGVYSSNAFQAKNSTISSNSASFDGGAIYCLSGTIDLNSLSLSGNTASYDGGAIYLPQSATAATIVNSTITGNSSASDGGAIYGHATLTVVNSTLAGNRTNYRGGGIATFGQATVIGSVLAGNWTSSSSSGTGGGIHNEGTLWVLDSTITANTAGNGASAVGGGIYYPAGSLTVNNSIFWVNSGGEIDGSGKFTGKWNLIGIDPGFVRNPSDGGDGWRDDPSTTAVDESANNDFGDMHLTDHSLAVNYGDNNLLPLDTQDLNKNGVTDESIPYDRGGQPRRFGLTVDCGVYELQSNVAEGREAPSTVVTTSDDTFNVSDGHISLREAIYYAGTGSIGTTITFSSPPLDGATLTLGGIALWLDKPLTIDAAAIPHGLTIDADGKSRVFRVTADNVTLDSLTITGGAADSGGAILNSGDLTIKRSTLVGNSATGSGGAIFNASGTLRGCDFFDDWRNR